MKLLHDNNKYYVYVIYDIENMIPIYVGKGRGRRYLWHITASKGGYHYNKKLEHKLKKITNNFDSIDRVSIKFDSEYELESDALDREIELIAEIGLQNLCNLSIGGDSPNHSEETTRKIIDSRRANGIPWHSTETRIKIGNSRRGKLHSEETKQNMKINHKRPMLGKRHSNCTREKMSKNHADFNGDKNPFYKKSHTTEVRNYFREKYSVSWKIIHNNMETIVTGKSGVKQYIENYNRDNGTTISYKSLFVYKKVKKYNICLVKTEFGGNNG